MFTTETGKAIGAAIRKDADVLRTGLRDVFELSIVGQKSEVRFFDKLLSGIEQMLRTTQVAGLNLKCRIARTHQKPLVKVGDPTRFSCELADLLVVVKYQIEPGVIERKSLFYQVKLCDAGTSNCKIDQNQLELLTLWPRFGFGRKGIGGIHFYDIVPKTLELGSYMLMMRAPISGEFIPCRSHFCNLHAYGISPCAAAVRTQGPKTVDISSFPYAANASDVFFSHLGFEIGEHHDFNEGVVELVHALYRHLNIDPDPPGEFEGYTRAVGEDEIGFAILEITIGRSEDNRENSVGASVWDPPGKKKDISRIVKPLRHQTIG